MDQQLLIDMYRTMLKIRLFEEKVGDLVLKGRIKTPCHLYIGQEAVATGVCKALKKDDYILGNHRSHGHYIAKGGDLGRLMAELLGRKTGCSGGRGGSMHLIAPEIGFLGTSAIVAGSIPLAVGTALASRMRGEERVTVVFFGDGATDEGLFYESINFAALDKLPVLFVCENNFYSSHLRVDDRHALDNIKEKAESFGIKSGRVDGNDVLEVFDKTKRFIDEIKNGGNPRFIEALTFRWRGHVGPNWDLDNGIRDAKEVQSWMGRCPIKKHQEFLLKENILSETGVNEINNSVVNEVDKSLEFAEESEFPDKNKLLKGVFK